MNRFWIIPVVIAVAVLMLLCSPVPVKFGNYSIAEFTQQLTPLVLVSLFIERSLEIFITVWRGGTETTLQRAVEAAQSLADNVADKTLRVQQANDNLRTYRFQTQQIALRSGLILGLLIAFLGVRGLGNFVVFSASTSDIQKSLFNLADVLLTGAVMGGGSDFMHKLITTFTDLMNATSQKAKNAAA